MKEKRPTQKEIADKHKVSTRTIMRYLKDGVDIYDDNAIQKHKESLPDCNLNYYDDLDGNAPVDAATLKLEKLRYETGIKKYDEILSKFEAEKMEGKLVDIATVEESMIRIATTIQAQLKAMEVFLPSKLQGLTSKQMVKVLQESNTEILEYLYNEFKITKDT